MPTSAPAARRRPLSPPTRNDLKLSGFPLPPRGQKCGRTVWRTHTVRNPRRRHRLQDHGRRIAQVTRHGDEISRTREAEQGKIRVADRFVGGVGSGDREPPACRRQRSDVVDAALGAELALEHRDHGLLRAAISVATQQVAIEIVVAAADAIDTPRLAVIGEVEHRGLDGAIVKPGQIGAFVGCEGTADAPQRDNFAPQGRVARNIARHEVCLFGSRSTRAWHTGSSLPGEITIVPAAGGTGFPGPGILDRVVHAREIYRLRACDARRAGGEFE